jgi:hypothetical protein
MLRISALSNKKRNASSQKYISISQNIYRIFKKCNVVSTNDIAVFLELHRSGASTRHAQILGFATPGLNHPWVNGVLQVPWL